MTCMIESGCWRIVVVDRARMMGKGLLTAPLGVSREVLSAPSSPLLVFANLLRRRGKRRSLYAKQSLRHCERLVLQSRLCAFTMGSVLCAHNARRSSAKYLDVSSCHWCIQI
jgi:hypothetical protein